MAAIGVYLSCRGLLLATQFLLQLVFLLRLRCGYACRLILTGLSLGPLLRLKERKGSDSNRRGVAAYDHRIAEAIVETWRHHVIQS